MRTIEQILENHVPLNVSSKDELSDEIQRKAKEFGNFKVNLTNGVENEGLWCTMDTAEDKEAYESNEDGFALVYLTNYPLMFGFWGMPILVRLHPTERPTALTVSELRQYPKLLEEIEHLFTFFRREERDDADC